MHTCADDLEYCTYPITVDNGINPFRYRQDTSAGSQHLLHAVIALACHHRQWPSVHEHPPAEVTQHQGQAVKLFRNALETSAADPRRLSMLDTLLALWCMDATQSALSTWRDHLRVAYDLLEGAGGVSSWSLSSRVQAQVSMFMWWDGVVALLSRRPCIFPYSYLETVLPWEGVQSWGFFDLNGCPRELLVPMIQLANLTESLDSSGKLPVSLRELVAGIEENIRNYKPVGGAPADDFVVDLPDEEAEDYFNVATDYYHCCEAFRYALLLYILRVFKRAEGITNYHARLRHLSRLVMDHVISIQDSSSIRKQLLLTIFLAGAETKLDAHRHFIRGYCAKWYEVYGYQMFTTALEILEELWSNSDAGETEIWWGDVLDVRRRTDTRNPMSDFCFG
ncbi:fungal-specific transcription factor domain-containing protein [Exophiala viscosa]|uniref:fungal-specific transcription factor domain-containing protein n=1 Tax=Exophiala viscosa TaxID=2486360 RepID=UPI00218D7B92|nr:fungal-specific transcription factor domain-containing protein [Exophiala viscosa]